MTSGMMLPLMTADMLAMTIVGSVLENMDMERLIGGQCRQDIGRLSKADMFRNRSAGRSAN